MAYLYFYDFVRVGKEVILQVIMLVGFVCLFVCVWWPCISLQVKFKCADFPVYE